MIEHGIESPAFMVKAALVNVPQRQLYFALANLVDHLNEQEENYTISVPDLLDRIVQVAVTGEYKPSEKSIVDEAVEEINKLLAGGLNLSAKVNGPTPISEEDLEKFLKGASDAPDADDPMDGFKLDDQS